MALITSASQAPCGTQDTSFPFRAGLLPARGAEEEKSQASFPERKSGAVLGLPPPLCTSRELLPLEQGLRVGATWLLKEEPKAEGR